MGISRPEMLTSHGARKQVMSCPLSYRPAKTLREQSVHDGIYWAPLEAAAGNTLWAKFNRNFTPFTKKGSVATSTYQCHRFLWQNPQEVLTGQVFILVSAIMYSFLESIHPWLRYYIVAEGMHTLFVGDMTFAVHDVVVWFLSVFIVT